MKDKSSALPGAGTVYRHTSTTQSWRRQTNVWRKVTSPARGVKRLRSVNRDRRRCTPTPENEAHGREIQPKGTALSIEASLNISRTKHKKASTMKLVPPDTCLKDYKKRRSAFLEEMIASTPNVSVRAKEFRRWIDENSNCSDNEKVLALDGPRALA